MTLRSGAIVLLGVLMLVSTAVSARSHGELRKLEFGGVAAWDSSKSDWVTPDAFWRSYVKRSAGRSWGTRDSYPAAKDVLELDNVIMKFEGGTCLMEFSESRWQRANDVYQWDPGFNEVAGCPNATY